MAARRTAFESTGLPQLMFKIIRTAFDPLPMAFSRPFQVRSQWQHSAGHVRCQHCIVGDNCILPVHGTPFGLLPLAQ
jgi:hypothetical protein